MEGERRGPHRIKRRCTSVTSDGVGNPLLYLTQRHWWNINFIRLTAIGLKKKVKTQCQKLAMFYKFYVYAYRKGRLMSKVHWEKNIWNWSVVDRETRASLRAPYTLSWISCLKFSMTINTTIRYDMTMQQTDVCDFLNEWLICKPKI